MLKYDKYCSASDFDVPNIMQALVVMGKGFENLEVKEIPVPSVGPDQLLARVDAAGVCTSILKLIEQGENHTFLNGWDMKKWPIILGDEGSASRSSIGVS
jgi:D-arabinose 1-dehydrogenase-like Zn-dependent alcohol dehydrogenase